MITLARTSCFKFVSYTQSKPTTTKYHTHPLISSTQHAVLRQELCSSMPKIQGVGASSDQVERDEHHISLTRTRIFFYGVIYYLGKCGPVVSPIVSCKKPVFLHRLLSDACIERQALRRVWIVTVYLTSTANSRKLIDYQTRVSTCEYQQVSASRSISIQAICYNSFMPEHRSRCFKYSPSRPVHPC